LVDPRELYDLASDLPDMGQPVLVQALTGFVDAGAASRLVREHLLDTLESTEVATFDVDQMLDYRARRPIMDFVEDHWASYDEPRLVVHLLRDAQETPFLLLEGPEPDFAWERFVTSAIDLIDRLGVRVTVGLNAIPMGVPHTRPVGVTAHATRADLISGYEPWLQRVRVPAGVGHLLEYRLGQRGLDAIGFAAHVPHYLAQNDYPAAAEQLLASISKATGLLLPTEALRTAAEEVRTSVDAQVEESDEATGLVRALEQQYDSFMLGRDGGANLLAAAGPLPSAEELGAELERFLAEHTNPGDQPG
jgi:predicted ATP-grasp superfamily ATP-dependent carboligase